MEARPTTLSKLFEVSVRYRVPLFQRPYIWNEKKNWNDFSNDILDVAYKLLNKSSKKIKKHFLGAIVLQLESKAIGEQDKAIVIDGQQRLITSQLFISALRDLAINYDVKDNLIYYLDSLISNNYDSNNDSNNDEVDILGNLKVFPTQSDRTNFACVIQSKSPKGLLKLLGKKSNSKRVNENIPDCYLYFYEEIETYIKDNLETNDLDIIFESIKNSIVDGTYLVNIQIDDDDEPQVIFETLNFRGTPLVPSDLVKNYIFRMLDEKDKNTEQYYKQYWNEFDEDIKYWRKEVGRGKRGMLNIDLFLHAYLCMLTKSEIKINELFSSLKDYVNSNENFEVIEFIINFNKFSKIYKSFDEKQNNTQEYIFFNRIKKLETRTLYPLLLHLYSIPEFNNDIEEKNKILNLLESYLIRRMICQYTTKNYNRYFVQLLKSFLNNNIDFNYKNLFEYVIKGTGDSVLFPNDEILYNSFTNIKAYQTLPVGRCRMILKAINQFESNDFVEYEPTGKSKVLHIEHLMPKSWKEHWTPQHVSNLFELENTRNELIDTFGNLTLLTDKLNISISNGPWEKKKEKILEHSVLTINKKLREFQKWDEEKIKNRTKSMFETFKEIWPYSI